MMNREIYEKDPRPNTLLNQGVAKVTSGQTDRGTGDAALRAHQLRLRRPVRRGVGPHPQHLPRPPGQARAAGRLGQRLLRLAASAIWSRCSSTSGPTSSSRTGPRPAGWPSCRPSVKDLLKELSTQAKRKGGLHAAAGTLGAGARDSVRLELLGIIFKSVGLPGDYSRACFLMWLRDEGLEDAVRQHIADGGRRLREGADQPLRLRRDRQGDPGGPARTSPASPPMSSSCCRSSSPRSTTSRSTT